MAAFIIDLDGTMFTYHTNTFLPNVVETLAPLVKAGHEIIFITYRDDARDSQTEWSEGRTRDALATLPFPYRLLTGVQPGRILIDDTTPHAISVETNNSASWPALRLR